MNRVLCALLVLLAMSGSAAAEEAKPVTAILIVARAELPDPNFKDSVVLVMNNIAPAPAGLIVNRPTKISVSQLFPDDERLAKLEDKVYFGGPVQIETVSFLFRTAAAPAHAMPVAEGVYLSMDAELLRTLLHREKPMEGLRIFIGYAGWGPGQLQAEIARGDWTLAPADANAVFGGKSEHPWPEPEAAGAGPRI